MLDRTKGKDLAVIVVWVPMMEADDEAAARESAKILAGDPRVVTQIWDPKRVIGAAYRDAHSPGDAQTEWDIYLWYAKDARWKDPAPEPFELLRQIDFADGKSVMKRGRTDAEPYAASLPEEMAKATDRLLSAP